MDVVNDPYGAANWARDNVRKATGFVFDPMMAEHFNPWDPKHVERPARSKFEQILKLVLA